MKKWLNGFVATAAGRAQLVGWIVALAGGTAWGAKNPAFLAAMKEHGPALVVGIVAIIGAVDASGVAAANIKKAKEEKK